MGSPARVATLAAVLLAGCTHGAARPPVTASPVPPVARCGAPAPIVATRDSGYAVRAGPFTFLGGATRDTIRRVVGPPAKVVFAVERPYPETYVVTGLRCSDGAPLRFWYGHDGTPPPPGGGDDHATLPPQLDPPPRGTTHGLGGYLLLASPGRWRLDFTAGGTPRASVVVDFAWA